MKSGVLVWSVAATLALVALGPGCWEPPKANLPEASPRWSEDGLVWMFGGLLGAPGELEPAYRGLRDAGLQKEVRFFEWNRPAYDFIAHLTDYEANQAQAGQAAKDIVAYHNAYPEQPIDLVGYSAGAAIAVMVAEVLPEDVHIRNLVFAQGDLSPTYDLTECLRRVDGKLIVFYSPNDWFLSGVFNLLLGTMDREYVVSAGKDGFDLEAAVPDETLRLKVEQVGWSREMAEVGHPGFHMAILQYRWNKHFVAPYVVAPENLRVELAEEKKDAAADE